MKIGGMLINYIASERRRGSGFKLYIKILSIFFLPVLAYQILFYKIREYIAVIIKKYVIYEYWNIFNNLEKIYGEIFNPFVMMKISYIFIDIVNALMIISFIVWYRTTSDIITQNIVNEFQETLVVGS